MRNSRLIAAAMSMLGLMLVCSAARADQMDNPRFTAWSKFGVGSTASYDTTMSGQGGQQMTMEWTTKLLEKADDHVTLESSVNIMGQTHTSKQTVSAKTEKKDIKQVGTEDVQVAGKTITCKVYEGKDMMSGAPQGGAGGGPGGPAGRGRGRGGADGGDGGGAGGQAPERSGKFWVSDQVPGGLVKMTGEGPRGDIQIMLKSYEAK